MKEIGRSVNKEEVGSRVLYSNNEAMLIFDLSNICLWFFVSALLVENGKFLLSAKRNRRTTCTEYVISMDADNISRSSSTYIGKLR